MVLLILRAGLLDGAGGRGDVRETVLRGVALVRMVNTFSSSSDG